MASITLNFSPEHAVRIQGALKETLDLRDENGDPRDATVADFKEYVIANVRQFVRSSERRVAARAAQALVDDVEVT